jgi:hypothetical protein
MIRLFADCRGGRLTVEIAGCTTAPRRKPILPSFTAEAGGEVLNRRRAGRQARRGSSGASRLWPAPGLTGRTMHRLDFELSSSPAEVPGYFLIVPTSSNGPRRTTFQWDPVAVQALVRSSPGR